jgi:hypothetical protein
MKRDLDLMRKILLAIEEQYEPGDGLFMGLQVEGYDSENGMQIIAEHCKFLLQNGFISGYDESRGGDKIVFFRVGNITYQGYDYLDKIRNPKIWEKIKGEIKSKELPQTVEIITKIAGIFTGNVIKEIQP